ncbi:Myb/SANT-like DNA-binding domain-containing protein [Xylaria cubensis]|nr:Myb/SANT-like DNA-binding domain-containing protein [Xylaria cubensis]
MADDDVQLTAATTTSTNGSTMSMRASSRRNADRRTPRFSWNLAYEDTFFRSLCESMQLGYKDSHNFKAGAWERAAVALRDRHGAYPEKSHLINKADNARKKFRMWRGLREDPDFLYNPNTRMVTASEEAWSRHFEKEPLSKALRGRPFDHEEYMEILFPDVVGSGGAPKRIMKPRRRNPDGSMPPRPSDIDTSALDPALDASTVVYGQTPSQTPLQQMPPPTQPLSSPATAQRSVSTAIPPRTSTSAASNINALTPPDEPTPDAQARKRPNPDPALGNPERRRGRPSRFAPSFYNQSSTASVPPASSSTGGGASSTSANLANTNTNSTPPPLPVPTGLVETGILSLAEALRAARAAPKWPEQAVEILFREFADEDLDLQLKIAEKALTDDNKAMVFVKMTPVLRRHWVGRLRDFHMRNLGGSGLGLGRVGEEGS